MGFRFSSVPLTLASVLIFPAVICTALLYLYPLFFGCEFPPAHSPRAHCALNPSAGPSEDAKHSTLAPFRLLAFGDPQLEGDTSLPDYSERPVFPSIGLLGKAYKQAIEQKLYALSTLSSFANCFWDDLKLLGWSYRKRVDLWGNDLYLAHQYRTLHWWLNPTHVTVLGDLLGSQWIGDDEFERRADRFWGSVFKHGKRVPDAIANGKGHREALGENEEWDHMIINVPGNHDVGYAGDLTEERMARYEDAFGRTNWDGTFTLPMNGSRMAARHSPAIRIVTLNSMNLDSPAFSSSLQSQTYAYLNDVIRRSNAMDAPDPAKTLTLFLTHVPLHKPNGVCVDNEYFTYHDPEYGSGIREQNHLSRDASKPILEGVFGLSPNPLSASSGKRAGLILTGHDHEGCSAYHYLNTTNPHADDAWSAVPYAALTPSKYVTSKALLAQRDYLASPDVPGVREETLRSMMGEFGGHAGLVSAWWDDEEGWRVEVGGCDAGVQHLWWGVHVLDLVFVLCTVGGGLFWVVEEVNLYRAYWRQQKERERRQKRELSRRRSKSRGKSKSVSRTPSYRGSNGMTPNGSVKGSVKSSTRGRSKGSGREVATPSGSIRMRRREDEVDTPGASIRKRRRDEGLDTPSVSVRRGKRREEAVYM